MDKIHRPLSWVALICGVIAMIMAWVDGFHLIHLSGWLNLIYLLTFSLLGGVAGAYLIALWQFIIPGEKSQKSWETIWPDIQRLHQEINKDLPDPLRNKIANYARLIQGYNKEHPHNRVDELSFLEALQDS